jgi:hypothetical protein
MLENLLKIWDICRQILRHSRLIFWNRHVGRIKISWLSKKVYKATTTTLTVSEVLNRNPCYKTNRKDVNKWNKSDTNNKNNENRKRTLINLWMMKMTMKISINLISSNNMASNRNNNRGRKGKNKKDTVIIKSRNITRVLAIRTMTTLIRGMGNRLWNFSILLIV